MANSAGTEGRRRMSVRDAMVATCDKCGAPMQLMIFAEGLETVLACNLCRHWYPVADVLLVMRQAIARLSRPQ